VSILGSRQRSAMLGGPPLGTMLASGESPAVLALHGFGATTQEVGMVVGIARQLGLANRWHLRRPPLVRLERPHGEAEPPLAAQRASGRRPTFTTLHSPSWRPSSDCAATVNGL